MFQFLYRNVKKESFGILYLQILAITQTLLALLTTWLSARLIDEIGQECEPPLLITLVFCPNDFYIYSRKSKLLLDLYIKRNAMIMRGLIIIKVNETEH